jgi:polysaccharide pyruvyl transferase WcaK-like protein
MRVLLIGGDADGNLGDRAILTATCQELRSLLPGIDLTVSSRDPARARRDLGVTAVPSGPRGFLRLCLAASRANLILCGGGGLFQDDDSLVKMPYWAARTLWLRLFCRRIVGFSLGVGPLEAPSSRLFARLAFRTMERISVRDPFALRTARGLTAREVEVVPDPALQLAPRSVREARSWLSERGVPVDGTRLIGVAPRRIFPPRRRLVPHKVRWRLGRRRQSGDTIRLTELLAGVLDQVAEAHDAHVIFLPSYAAEHEQDVAVSHSTLERMAHERGQVLQVTDPALYGAIAGQLDLMLGGRMHPTILAAAAGTPVVGLSYNQKFSGFFDLLGSGDRVLDVVGFVRNDRSDELRGLLEDALAGGRLDTQRVTELQDRTRDYLARVIDPAAHR